MKQLCEHCEKEKVFVDSISLGQLCENCLTDYLNHKQLQLETTNERNTQCEKLQQTQST